MFLPRTVFAPDAQTDAAVQEVADSVTAQFFATGDGPPDDTMEAQVYFDSTNQLLYWKVSGTFTQVL
jgi:hypothetical protein